MSTLRCTNLQDTSGSNSSTTEQIASGRAKAWVNFNGTSTVAIRANFNVNSITDNGTGNYNVNFTTAMADTNYATIMTGSSDAENNTPMQYGMPTTTPTAGSVKIYTASDNTVYRDHVVVNVAVFR